MITLTYAILIVVFCTAALCKTYERYENSGFIFTAWLFSVLNLCTQLIHLYNQGFH